MAYVGLHARHYLGLVLAPVLFLLAAQDMVAWLAPNWSQQEHGVLFYGPMLVLIALALPWLLSRIWKTEPLAPGPLRTRLEAIARQAKAPMRDILVWRTDGQMVNAAVAGFTPWLRYVFLTDGLLQQLNDEEIAAVVGHEVAHVKRRHVMLRILVLCAPLAVWSAVQAWAPQSQVALEGWLSRWGASPTWQQAIVAPALVGVYAFFMLGWLARMLEHDADAWAGARPLANDVQGTLAAPHLIAGAA